MTTTGTGTSGSRPLASPESPPPVGEPVRPHLPPRAAARRRHRTPLAWLPGAALAAALLLLGLMVLWGLLAGSSDSSPPPPAAVSGTTGGTTGGAGGTPTLTAGSTDLLAGPGRIGALSGGQVIGRDVTVQEVVADEGFWVGRSSTDRVFVSLSPEARAGAGESPFRVKAGQRIDLTGTVRALGAATPRSFGVSGSEGARQLAQQRAYVRATSVRLSS